MKKQQTIIQCRLYKKEDIELYQQYISGNNILRKNDILTSALIYGIKQRLLEKNNNWIMELIDDHFSKKLKKEFYEQKKYLDKIITPIYISNNILQQIVIFIVNQIGETNKNLTDYRNPTEFMLNPPPWIKDLVNKIEEEFFKEKVIN